MEDTDGGTKMMEASVPGHIWKQRMMEDADGGTKMMEAKVEDKDDGGEDDGGAKMMEAKDDVGEDDGGTQDDGGNDGGTKGDAVSYRRPEGEVEQVWSFTFIYCQYVFVICCL